MQRFTYGEAVLEQFISQKAMIAGAPIERGETLSMLEAIDTRQDALDALRETIHDYYRIEHGTRTASRDSEIPLPFADDPAVMHRMTYLGDSRWKYESVVPRSPDAHELDPISLNMEFLAEPGTREYEAVEAWSEWGIPFQDVPVRIATTGGPFPDDEPVESFVSFVALRAGGDEPSTLYLRCVRNDGRTRFRLPLTVAARTEGARTGWIRVVVDTPERALRFELRFKQDGETDVRAHLGNVDGRNPEAVHDELTSLLNLSDGDVLSLEAANRQLLVQAHEPALPSGLQAVYLPVASHLTQLQSHTESVLVMPDIAEITDRQFGYLELLASIYAGKAHTWSWRELGLEIPQGDEAERIRAVALDALSGGYTVMKVETPVFDLGNRTYTIDHPLASTAHSVALEPGIDPAELQPGDTFRLVPGPDHRVTTAKIVDWTPESSPWLSSPRQARN